MAELKLKNIYKVYDGGVRAVSNFSLDIKDKEFVVFVGPSGCGKSTTLRMIAGLEAITSGELYIGNTLMNDVEPKDRNIAMVFQNYALYPHMTVFQNMAFGLKLRKLPPEDIERRVKEAAEILGITDLLSRKPKALSGGQRQRVALGRAIVREPSVFLLDEPLSNLDAKLRVQMRTEITKLHKKLQTTFIYVTHDQTEAMTMGDKIVVMKDGFIQQIDSPATLYDEPINVFVATFLGSPQMNVFPVTLSYNNQLNASFGSNTISFPEIKCKQLLNKKHIEKEVLFGIRPENIQVSETEGIDATVDQVEHLGSQTIIYAKVDGIKNNIIATIPTNHDITSGLKIKLLFDMDKSHLFDKETSLSIMGVPKYNELDSKIIHNPYVDEHLFDFSEEKCKHLKIDTTKVSLDEIPDSLKLRLTIDFKVSGSDATAYYCKITNSSQLFVFRSTNHSLQNGSDLDAYISNEDLIFTDENDDRVISKEKILPNVAKCTTKTIDNKTTITFGKNKLVFDDLKVSDGEHEIKLYSDKVDFVYDKKYAKKNKIDIKDVDYTNTINVSSYDEDDLGSKNAVFVQVSGFDNYVTFVLDNKFSVYKMPKFKIKITKDSFELKD